MPANPGGQVVALLTAGATCGATTMIFAHTGKRSHLLVASVLVWAGLVCAAWLAFPTTIPASHLGRLLAPLLGTLPSLAATTAVMALTQWRPVPIRPWVTLLLGAVAFAMAALLGQFLAVLALELTGSLHE
jgi:hypothetical protein